jgi:beta-glucosidase
MTPTPRDLDGLLATLDLPAKVRLLTGASSFTLVPAPEIGLAEVRLSDGPTGVRGLTFSGGRWWRCAQRDAAGLGVERGGGVRGRRPAGRGGLAQGIHVVLGPTINLHRSPLGGRLFEAYSRTRCSPAGSPRAYVRGLQERGVGGCLKHLVANESETERNTVDSVVDEATLRELYLLPFEIAVARRSRGRSCRRTTTSTGCRPPSRTRWSTRSSRASGAWDGLVMSDWFATKSPARPRTAGWTW